VIAGEQSAQPHLHVQPARRAAENGSPDAAGDFGVLFAVPVDGRGDGNAFADVPIELGDA